MHSISINDKLYNDIKDYCKLNKIKVTNFCNELLEKSFNNLKYGDIPFGVVEQFKGNAVPVQYDVPIENHIEPIEIENIPVRPVANEILHITPINQPENLPNETPVEICEKTKQSEARKKRTRELK